MPQLKRWRFVPITLLLIAAAALSPHVARADTCTTLTTIQYSGTFGPPRPVSTDPPLLFIVDHLTGTSPLLGEFTATFPHLANLATGEFAGVATYTAQDGSKLFVLATGTASMTSPTAADVTLTGSVLDGAGTLDGARGRLSGTGTVDLATSTVGTTTLQGTIRRDC